MDEIFYKDVFISGEEGYHTYRIPSLINTKDNILLAFAEGRTSRADISQIDIVLKRSKDQGRTWEKLKIIAEDGKNSYVNPCSVQIDETRRIFLFLQHYPFPCRERETIPGISGSKVCRNFVLHSDNNGKDWSDPKDITKESKRPLGVTTIASGPGIAIQKKREPYKGRIIVPMNQGPYGKWKNYAVFSDDLGETWKYGELIPSTDKIPGGNEIQMIELTDGSILANARSYPIYKFWKKKCRKISYSRDGGYSWEEYQNDQKLIEPCCQASIIRFSDPLDGLKSRILFLNPASQTGRKKGTIRISYDEGNTWEFSRLIEKGKFAYSCLVKLKDNSIGYLYETGKKDSYECLKFANTTLNWITHGKDRIL